MWAAILLATLVTRVPGQDDSCAAKPLSSRTSDIDGGHGVVVVSAGGIGSFGFFKELHALGFSTNDCYNRDSLKYQRPHKLFDLLSSEKKATMVSHIVVLVGSAADTLLTLCKHDNGHNVSELSVHVQNLDVDTSNWSLKMHNAVDKCHITGIAEVSEQFDFDPLDIGGFYDSWLQEAECSALGVSDKMGCGVNHGSIPIMFVPSETKFDRNLIGHPLLKFLNISDQSLNSTGAHHGNNYHQPEKPSKMDPLSSHTFNELVLARAFERPPSANKEDGSSNHFATLEHVFALVSGKKDTIADAVWGHYSNEGYTEGTLYNGTGKCMTNIPGCEGWGAEYQGNIRAYALAAHNGVKYCHTSHKCWPANHVPGLNERNSPEVNASIKAAFGERAETIMGFKPQQCNRCLKLTRDSLRHTWMSQHGNEVKEVLNVEILDEIRTIFLAGACKTLLTSKTCQYSEEHTDVAVHIRKGDVTYLSGQKKRNISEKTVVHQIEKLRKELLAAGQSPRFHIFSEGSQDQFPTIQAYNDTVWHMDEEPLQSFFCMVIADHIMRGRSSFSAVAALLTAGTIFWEKQFNQPACENTCSVGAGVRGWTCCAGHVFPSLKNKPAPFKLDCNDFIMSAVMLGTHTYTHHTGYRMTG